MKFSNHKNMNINKSQESNTNKKNKFHSKVTLLFYF